MILCNDESDANDEYLRMTLVLAENVREYDQENDIVLLHTSTLSQHKLDLMHSVGIKTGKVKQVLSKARAVEDPFGQVDFDASACYLAKARALQLLQYDKVMYVDSDIMFRSDPTSLFELPGFVGYDGSKSPLNGGLYVMDPSQQAFADIQDIANSKAFDEKNGWFQYGEVICFLRQCCTDLTFAGLLVRGLAQPRKNTRLVVLVCIQRPRSFLLLLRQDAE